MTHPVIRAVIPRTYPENTIGTALRPGNRHGAYVSLVRRLATSGFPNDYRRIT